MGKGKENLTSQPEKYFWAVEDIFKTQEDWEEEFNKTEKLVDFSEFRGKLADKETLYKCLKKQDEISVSVDRLYTYAMMLRDGDTRRADYDALLSKALSVYVKFSSETSFVVPEILSLEKGAMS